MQTAIILIVGGLSLVAGLVLGILLQRRRGAVRESRLVNEWEDRVCDLEDERRLLEKLNAELVARAAAAEQPDEERHRAQRELAEKVAELKTRLQQAADQQQALIEKNAQRQQQVARLKDELTKWEQRVPPLIEKFRERDREAQRLARRLEEAEERIRLYETQPSFDETRFDAVRPGDIAGMDAPSNQPMLTVVRGGAATARTMVIETEAELTDIRGIGPATCKSLAAHGVTSLIALLELAPEQIEVIGEDIKGFASRYPDWAEQARSLLES